MEKLIEKLRSARVLLVDGVKHTPNPDGRFDLAIKMLDVALRSAEEINRQPTHPESDAT